MAFLSVAWRKGQRRRLWGHDPLILGLFRKLPEPEADWPAAGHLKWLQTAANIFDLLYTVDGGGIVVSLARAERSPRPHDD